MIQRDKRGLLLVCDSYSLLCYIVTVLHVTLLHVTCCNVNLLHRYIDTCCIVVGASGLTHIESLLGPTRNVVPAVAKFGTKHYLKIK